MRRRLYFDTSVFGGVFDEEFSDYSVQLFERVKRGEVVCLFSEAVDRELSRAPSRVRQYAGSINPNSVERLKINEAAEDLADRYMFEKIVGLKSHDDCLHIALATVNNADGLVSWNFKHIVNENRVKLFNSVNLKLEYKEIAIHSPKHYIDHEKEED